MPVVVGIQLAVGTLELAGSSPVSIAFITARHTIGRDGAVPLREELPLPTA